MDEDQTVERAIDDLLARTSRPLAPGALAAAAALPEQVRSTRHRRRRWAFAGALTGVLMLGGTAAIAAPMLLAPMPGFTTLVRFSYGVDEGQPGIRCQTIVAVKPTPGDRLFDADIVARFSAYMRSQSFVIPVPAAAREPYTGGGDSTSASLYAWPGTEALNRSYSAVMGDVYERFDRTDPEERKYGHLDSGDPLSHSVIIQDTVSCSGHP